MNRAQRRRARSQVKPRLIHYPEDFDPDRAQAILANSGAMDAVSENDREWFKANPDRSYRLRPISEPERAVSNKVPLDPGVCSYVVIKQIKPGIRVRISFDAYPFHRPDDFSDNACAMLFAEAKEMSPPDFVKALEMMMEGM